MLGMQPTKSNGDYYTDTQHDWYPYNSHRHFRCQWFKNTQLLKTVALLRWFISGSTNSLNSEEAIPYSPCALSKDNSSEFKMGRIGSIS